MIKLKRYLSVFGEYFKEAPYLTLYKAFGNYRYHIYYIDEEDEKGNLVNNDIIDWVNKIIKYSWGDWLFIGYSHSHSTKLTLAKTIEKFNCKITFTYPSATPEIIYIESTDITGEFRKDISELMESFRRNFDYEPSNLKFNFDWFKFENFMSITYFAADKKHEVKSKIMLDKFIDEILSNNNAIIGVYNFGKEFTYLYVGKKRKIDDIELYYVFSNSYEFTGPNIKVIEHEDNDGKDYYSHCTNFTVIHQGKLRDIYIKKPNNKSTNTLKGEKNEQTC